jgi:hypothetical protein
LVSKIEKEHRLRVFDNKVLSKVFEPKRSEVNRVLEETA